jgi:hypothetical protein
LETDRPQPGRGQIIQEILRSAASSALTHRIFQGWYWEAKSSKIPTTDSILKTESYLSRYDLPLLSSGAQAALHAWLGAWKERGRDLHQPAITPPGRLDRYPGG